VLTGKSVAEMDARDHEQGLRQRFESHPEIRKRMEALEQDVLEGRATSFRAARTLLEIYSDLSQPTAAKIW